MRADVLSLGLNSKNEVADAMVLYVCANANANAGLCRRCAGRTGEVMCDGERRAMSVLTAVVAALIT
jgi:hypothetical protein